MPVHWAINTPHPEAEEGEEHKVFSKVVKVMVAGPADKKNKGLRPMKVSKARWSFTKALWVRGDDDDDRSLLQDGYDVVAWMD